MERDFADRTTRVIIDKTAPFYVVRGILVLTWPKSISWSNRVGERPQGQLMLNFDTHHGASCYSMLSEIGQKSVGKTGHFYSGS